MVKKNYGALAVSICEKRACINSADKSLSIQRQCDLIGLPRSIYYREQQPALESVENLALMRLIDEEYTRHPFYGTRKMRYYLRRKGYQVNRKRVQRLMQKMGLQSIAPKPNTSKLHPEHKVYPYLLRNQDIICPDQVWVFGYYLHSFSWGIRISGGCDGLVQWVCSFMGGICDDRK